jgi:hypothetical protein
MIDRIWYLWQLRQGINNIPPAYLQLPLVPFKYAVEQVLRSRNEIIKVHKATSTLATGSKVASKKQLI